ncbi:hypothetical protein [Hallella mizrahii]|uniref:Uncharacterized protein n=1 Tax=Hallella mizrahii TaxID=2606637 RepID=A0A7K0KID3_9BACT|nr:hypothetical protein [Hallella mizrahii]MST85592.1 hypothetical protein [Hallella mizrahii]
MKNILTIACVGFLMAATSCKAQDNLQLPKPLMDNQVTLMQALRNGRLVWMLSMRDMCRKTSAALALRLG